MKKLGIYFLSCMILFTASVQPLYADDYSGSNSAISFLSENKRICRNGVADVVCINACINNANWVQEVKEQCYSAIFIDKKEVSVFVAGSNCIQLSMQFVKGQLKGQAVLEQNTTMHLTVAVGNQSVATRNNAITECLRYCEIRSSYSND